MSESDKAETTRKYQYKRIRDFGKKAENQYFTKTRLRKLISAQFGHFSRKKIHHIFRKHFTSKKISKYSGFIPTYPVKSKGIYSIMKKRNAYNFKKAVAGA